MVGTLTRRLLAEERRDDRTYIVVGCDLGQRVDPSAVVVTEVAEVDTGREREERTFADGSSLILPVIETVYRVRYVERLPLRTSFRNVGRRLAEIVRNLEERIERPDITVVADRTGLGIAAVEILREELGSRTPITGAIVTVGDQAHGTLGSFEARIPKAALTSRVQALLDDERIEFPDSPQAEPLAEELKSFFGSPEPSEGSGRKASRGRTTILPWHWRSPCSSIRPGCGWSAVLRSGPEARRALTPVYKACSRATALRIRRLGPDLRKALHPRPGRKSGTR
jgi:hypothetical protein